MSNTSGTSSVLETARSAAAEAGLDPAKLAQDVGAKLKDAAESQKHAGAEKVMGVARAIRNAAGNIEQDSPEMARYVRSAASSIESFTRDFDDRSVDDLGQAVVDMARRSPGLFFAGSMLAGFALFRFLNAAQGAALSGSRNQNWSSRRGSSMEGGAQRHLQAGSSARSPQGSAQPSSHSSSQNAQRGAGQGGYGSSSAGGYDVGGSSSSGSSASGSSSSGSSSSGSSSPGSSSSHASTSPAAGAGGYGGGSGGAAKPASTQTSGASTSGTSNPGRGQS